jgi:uncharacterized protein with NRDE domain
VCLLVVLTHVHPDYPLVVAANRDELRDRPATPMELHRGEPRILGGRDLLAGGTWLAVNEFGVVAGLTNLPATAGRDPSKRSRGELPLFLAAHATAAGAVEAFVESLHPIDYNPAWIIVGDRDHAFSIDMTKGDRADAAPLAPGVHIVENAPPDMDTPKVAHVRARLAGIGEARDLVAALRAVIADHEIPDGAREIASERRPAEAFAACVHMEKYGTRWSAIVRVPAPPSERPELLFADGPPCTTEFVDAAAWWDAEPNTAG